METNTNELVRKLVTYAAGNPGAASFLRLLLMPGNETFFHTIMRAMDRIPSLRGTNLYVLYSDLCRKDLNLVSFLCDVCPDDILADACSRQDYSGRELVKSYLPEVIE